MFLRDWILVTRSLSWETSRFGEVWRQLATIAIGYSGPAARVFLVFWLLFGDPSLDNSVVCVFGLVIFGTLGRSAAWGILGAATLGFFALDPATLFSMVTVAWLGTGRGSLTVFDDDLYFRRGFVFGKLIQALLASVLVAGLSLAIYSLSLESLDDAWRALSALSASGLMALTLMNILVLLSLTMKGFCLLRFLGESLGLMRWFLIRQIGFIVSFLTPGPQVGGEPLQVWLLRRRGVDIHRAVIVAAGDKIADGLVNLVMFMVGLIVFAGGQTLGTTMLTHELNEGFGFSGHLVLCVGGHCWLGVVGCSSISWSQRKAVPIQD